jgi:AraC-like DNA-binding protein
MDLLSELFRETGLRRRRLDLQGLPRDGAIRFPCDRSVGCHVVLSGTVYVHSSRLAQPLRLEAGDIAVMGRGCDHLLASSADAALVAAGQIAMMHDGTTPAGSAETVISGAYQLWSAPVHPFFAELPEWFVLRASETAQIASIHHAVALLAAEAAGDALGRETVVHGLLDVLFTCLLREIVARSDARTPGWCHAMQDSAIRLAVQRLHDACEKPWTLALLAREVGVSRSALAARFRTVMGDTPLAYLRTARLQRAMRLLTEPGRTLEQVATAVGYTDAFGFSKAFKRAVGMSPGEYRRRDAADALLDWRLPAEQAIG